MIYSDTTLDEVIAMTVSLTEYNGQLKQSVVDALNEIEGFAETRNYIVALTLEASRQHSSELEHFTFYIDYMDAIAEVLATKLPAPEFPNTPTVVREAIKNLLETM